VDVFDELWETTRIEIQTFSDSAHPRFCFGNFLESFAGDILVSENFYQPENPLPGPLPSDG
jgi:hypothetical protein